MLHRLLGLLAALVAVTLGATSCSSDSAVASAARLPTAVPAPTVAGQSIESSPAPGSNERVAVVGVEAGSGLPVHLLPGIDQPVVGEVPNLADDLFGLGEAFRTPDDRVWWLIRWESLQGWVEPELAYVGATLDITDDLGATEPGQGAATVDELALAVANSMAFDSPTADIVLVRPAEVSDDLVGTAVVDIVGFADDSVLGYRLAVTGSASSTGGQSFVVTSVERTLLCSRGVGETGLCV